MSVAASIDLDVDAERIDAEHAHALGHQAGHSAHEIGFFLRGERGHSVQIGLFHPTHPADADDEPYLERLQPEEREIERQQTFGAGLIAQVAVAQGSVRLEAFRVSDDRQSAGGLHIRGFRLQHRQAHPCIREQVLRVFGQGADADDRLMRVVRDIGTTVA
jgi:hypothetical protein